MPLRGLSHAAARHDCPLEVGTLPGMPSPAPAGRRGDRTAGEPTGMLPAIMASGHRVGAGLPPSPGRFRVPTQT
eukprot:432514-Hanusia_phi.AAC.1